MVELYWSKHFKKRLLDRFGITLNKTYRNMIREAVNRGEVFTVLDSFDDGKVIGHVQVYSVQIESKEVMVLVGAKGAVLSAYRRNWFSKGKDGRIIFSWKHINNSKKANRKMKTQNIKMKRDRLIKFLTLLYGDHKPCLIR